MKYINFKRPEVTKILMQDVYGNDIVLQEKEQYWILIENLNNQKTTLSKSIMMFKRHLHNEQSFEIITKFYDYTNHILHYN